MKKVDIVSETKDYILCPYCGKSRHTISHLYPKEITNSFGIWYCDNCGGGFKGQLDKDNNVYLEKVEKRIDKCYDFLRNGNVLLIIESSYFDGSLENKDYFYDEHTCPTNYMGDVEKIINLDNFDADPHGIFSYVGTMTEKEYNNIATDDYIRADSVKKLLSKFPEGDS